MGRILDFYRRWISPPLHLVSGVSCACRFRPTCSEYAAAALMEHGALRGTALALYRFLRCHPLSRGGYDPVPGIGSAASRFGTDRGRHLP